MTFQNPALPGIATTSLLVSIVILFFLPLRPFLRRAIGSQWLCLLWLVFLVRLLMPWSLESPLGLINRWQHHTAEFSNAGSWKVKAGAVEQDDRKNAGANISPRPISAASPSVDASLNMPGIAWLAGVTISLGILAWRCYQTRRFSQTTLPTTDQRLLNIFASIPEKWRRNVELRVMDSFEVPTLAGIFRPKIWMPLSWIARFSDRELRNILLHELGHARRGDLIVQWLFAFAQCVHWFNPLVWIAARAARFDREMACDAWVLARSDANDLPIYGATLMKAVELLRAPCRITPGAVAMASCRKSLYTRILGINAFQHAPAWRGVISILILFAALAAGTTNHVTAQEEISSLAALQPGVTPDSKAIPALSGPLIKMECKFIEITEPAWKKLCAKNAVFNDLVPKFPELAHEKISFTALPGELSNLEKTAWQITAEIKLLTLLSGEEMPMMIKSLDQLDHVDLLSGPSVTTQNNQRAVIEIIREFRYPSTWEPNAKSPSGFSPSEFAEQDNGVSLEVQPKLDKDGMVELRLAPKIETFLGFLRNKEGRKIMLTAHDAKMDPDIRPVFSISAGKIVATIQPGQTILMGDVQLDHKNIGKDDGPDAEMKSLASHADFAPETVRHVLLIFVTTELVDRGQSAQSSPNPVSKPSLPQNADSKTPYGIIVQGKAGFVTSPFARDAGAVDVRGFPKDAEVKDPYSGKIFLVP